MKKYLLDHGGIAHWVMINLAAHHRVKLSGCVLLKWVNSDYGIDKKNNVQRGLTWEIPLTRILKSMLV